MAKTVRETDLIMTKAIGHISRLATRNATMIIHAISAFCENSSGPGTIPWMPSAPMNNAEVELPGIPSDSSGTIELAVTALFADSGAAMPSGAPSPHFGSSGRPANMRLNLRAAWSYER